MCYHDANKEFLSTTINFYVENFLFFVQHLDEYLSFDVEEEKDSGRDYPVGLLIGKNGSPSIRIGFVHYSGFEDAKNKWVTRSARMASHEGKVCTTYCVPRGKDLDKEQVGALCNIKANKKVCFYRNTAVALPLDSESIRFVKIPEKYQNIDHSKYTGLLSRKRYYDYFLDIDSFIFN